MTAKRFTLSCEKYDGTIFDDGKAMGCIDVVDMLNALNEENERLRRCINEIYTIARLEEV